MSKIKEAIEAAWQKSRGEEEYDPGYPVKASSNFVDGFKAGAEWAMQHQWISIEEELPPIQEDVLVMTDQCIDIAYREEDSIRFTGNMFDYDASQIVAWMPIPPLPKTEMK